MSGQVDLQQECTIYVRNLDERVTDKLLEELFIQVGPVNYVTIRDSQQPHKGPAETSPKKTANRYAFVEFADVESVLFACEVMDAIEIYGQKIKVQPRDNTLQKSIFTQMSMHTASWERHHPPATNLSVSEKGRPPARHSDIGVYNELERQTPGASGGKRVVTFNHSQGSGGIGQFSTPKMRSPPIRRAHPRADRQQHVQKWSSHPSPPLNFGFPSGGPSADLMRQQMQFDLPNRHFQHQRNFDGRRSAPYPSGEYGHFPRESEHGKFNR